MISAEVLADLLQREPSATILHFSEALFSRALAGLVPSIGTAKAARVESARVMRVEEMNFIVLLSENVLG
jgi:hypothetical protein